MNSFIKIYLKRLSPRGSACRRDPKHPPSGFSPEHIRDRDSVSNTGGLAGSPHLCNKRYYERKRWHPWGQHQAAFALRNEEGGTPAPPSPAWVGASVATQRRFRDTPRAPSLSGLFGDTPQAGEEPGGAPQQQPAEPRCAGQWQGRAHHSFTQPGCFFRGRGAARETAPRVLQHRGYGVFHDAFCLASYTGREQRRTQRPHHGRCSVILRAAPSAVCRLTPTLSDTQKRLFFFLLLLHCRHYFKRTYIH